MVGLRRVVAVLGFSLFLPNNLFAQFDMAAVVGRYAARDTLDARLDQADGRSLECLRGLVWEAGEFEVEVVKNMTDSSADFLVRFPSPKPMDDPKLDLMCCEWFCPQDAAESAPAVVVVHESGRSMVVGRTIARELRRRGVHAFMVQLPGYGERRVDERTSGNLINVFRQGVADVRRARDAVAALPGLENSIIGLQGTSLGGFVASLSAGIDDGFDCVFLCLSGGDLHGVLTTGERDAEQTLQRLLASGIKEDELQSLLKPIEPLELASRLKADKTWLFSATMDKVVPPASSKLLADAIGLEKEHCIEIWATHYSGVIYLPGICKKITTELERLSDESTE